MVPELPTAREAVDSSSRQGAGTQGHGRTAACRLRLSVNHPIRKRPRVRTARMNDLRHPHPIRSHPIRNALRLGALGLLLLVLAWRILVVGLADDYAEEETTNGAEAALRWRPNHPAALYQRGEALRTGNPVVAGPLLQASIWGDPTNALAYLVLADLWASDERLTAAVSLVEIADILGPMRIPALARSAAFWYEHDRPDLALERWSALLRNHPESSRELFPWLVGVADDPDERALLQPLLERPPDWWDRFFAYAVAHAPRVEAVMFLYQGRNRGQDVPTAAEQRVYLDRLWKEGRWPEAHRAWLGGLDAQSQEGLDLLYNGGFELPVTGIGFDWRIQPLPGVTVETVQTYGTRGGRALHVAFDGRSPRFRHVLHPLFLDPGRYRLQGRVRPDGLAAGQGLRWVVGCHWPDPQAIATSAAFAGKDDWQAFGLDFEVPAADCPLQVLRLEQVERVGGSDGPGGVWFDDLAISRRR